MNRRTRRGGPLLTDFARDVLCALATSIALGLALVAAFYLS